MSRFLTKIIFSAIGIEETEELKYEELKKFL